MTAGLSYGQTSTWPGKIVMIACLNRHNPVSLGIGKTDRLNYNSRHPLRRLQLKSIEYWRLHLPEFAFHHFAFVIGAMPLVGLTRGRTGRISIARLARTLGSVQLLA
jgi:hypothetical protein